MKRKNESYEYMTDRQEIVNVYFEQLMEEFKQESKKRNKKKRNRKKHK